MTEQQTPTTTPLTTQPQPWTFKNTLVGIIVVVIASAVMYREAGFQHKRELVHAFTDRYVTPFSSASPKPPYTRYHLGNHLIWVACVQSSDTCPENLCLRNALQQNVSAVANLCDAVQHDCKVSAHCSIESDCSSMNDVIGNALMLYVLPCAEEPSGDYEFADKLTIATQTFLERRL